MLCPTLATILINSHRVSTELFVGWDAMFLKKAQLRGILSDVYVCHSHHPFGQHSKHQCATSLVCRWCYCYRESSTFKRMVGSNLYLWLYISTSNIFTPSPCFLQSLNVIFLLILFFFLGNFLRNVSANLRSPFNSWSWLGFSYPLSLY